MQCLKMWVKVFTPRQQTRLAPQARPCYAVLKNVTGGHVLSTSKMARQGRIRNKTKIRPDRGREPVGHLQGSLGPSGPETPKKSEKNSEKGLLAPRPLESGRSLKKAFSGPFRDFFQTLETFSRLFPDPRGARPEALGDFFQIFSGFRARIARRPL